MWHKKIKNELGLGCRCGVRMLAGHNQKKETTWNGSWNVLAIVILKELCYVTYHKEKKEHALVDVTGNIKAKRTNIYTQICVLEGWVKYLHIYGVLLYAQWKNTWSGKWHCIMNLNTYICIREEFDVHLSCPTSKNAEC